MSIVTDWVARTKDVIEAMPLNTERAKWAAKAADILERRYASFLISEGASAPGADCYDFIAGITELHKIAIEEATS
jgi:hypothetical protein